MNFPAFANTLSTRNFSLPVVILYVTAGCNLRCIMCSYRDPLPDELTLDEMRALADSLSRLGLRHIVYSGGEPLVRRDLPDICRIFHQIPVKQSILTNGLLLEKRYDEVGSFLSEIIVSLDGPSGDVHNAIRGVASFDQIVKGIQSVIARNRRPKVSIRTVVQKNNFRYLSAMVDFAKSLGVDRISFLAADLYSQAFNRDLGGEMFDRNSVMLDAEEVSRLRELMGEFVVHHAEDIKSKFVSENEDKLFHIVQYFDAIAGRAVFPRNQCNAPMVSTVITSTGDILPCFFLPSVGNIRQGALEALLNSGQFRTVRKEVKAYSLKRCHECVCTLNVRPAAALMDRF